PISFCFLLVRRPLVPSLFPYTTLFRSDQSPVFGLKPLLQHPVRQLRRQQHAVAADEPSRLGEAAMHGDEIGPRNAIAVKKDDVADRKSTRLNSSHVKISYAVFCLKKKK